MWMALWWAGRRWKSGVLWILLRIRFERLQRQPFVNERIKGYGLVDYFSDDLAGAGLYASNVAGAHSASQKRSRNGSSIWWCGDRCAIRSRQRQRAHQDDEVRNRLFPDHHTGVGRNEQSSGAKARHYF